MKIVVFCSLLGILSAEGFSGKCAESDCGNETQLTEADFKNAKLVKNVPIPPRKFDEALTSAGKFEGDIAGGNADYIRFIVTRYILSDPGNTDISKGVAVRRLDLLWPNAVVPYSVSSSFSESSRANIAAAILEFSEKTCVRFVPRRNHRDYVYFFIGQGCYSDVGKTGGKQMLSIGYGCEQKGIIVHEMMHAIGFFHEQSRTDRDDYISIQWENIQRGMEQNFQKYGLWETQLLGLPYDYDSVMHYGPYAFSKNGQPTIQQKRKVGGKIGQRLGFSRIDALEINKLYNCSNSGPGPVKPSPEPELPTTTEIVYPTTTTRPLRTTRRPRPVTYRPKPGPRMITGTKLIIANGCHKEIQVAVHFRNHENKWVTGGWWIIRPNEQKRAVSSTNRHFYIHGETTDKMFTWASKEYFFCTCDQAGFWNVCGDRCRPQNFFHIDTGSYYTEYKLNLSCRT